MFILYSLNCSVYSTFFKFMTGCFSTTSVWTDRWTWTDGQNADYPMVEIYRLGQSGMGRRTETNVTCLVPFFCTRVWSAELSARIDRTSYSQE